MTDSIDLTGLTDSQMMALKAAKGDITKLTDPQLRDLHTQLSNQGGTRLYSPNPDAPTNYGGGYTMNSPARSADPYAAFSSPVSPPLPPGFILDKPGARDAGLMSDADVGLSQPQAAPRPGGAASGTFDIDGARKAGYSDGEIADFLGKQHRYDVGGARKVGYSNAEIIGHLAGHQANPFDRFDKLEANGGWRNDPVVSGGRDVVSHKPSAYDTGAAPNISKVARVVGQGAQGFNDSVADTVGWPVDKVTDAMKYAGLYPQKGPMPIGGTESIKKGFDYLSTLPGRAKDAVNFGSLAPFTENRTARFEPQGDAERYARAAGSGIGSAASIAVPAGAIARLPGLAGSLWGSVAGGLGAAPKMQAVASAAGNVVGEATDSPYAGMATSFALPLLTHGAQRTVSAAPAATTQESERRALLQYGKDNNLGPLTAGKILDSRKVQVLESSINKAPVPLLGHRVEATEAAGRNAYQRAALEKAGTYGETAATPDVLANTRAKIGQKFDSLENGTTVNLDGKFGADIANAKADFSKQLLDQMPQSIVKKLDELAAAHAVTASQASRLSRSTARPTRTSAAS